MHIHFLHSHVLVPRNRQANGSRVEAAVRRWVRRDLETLLGIPDVSALVDFVLSLCSRSPSPVERLKMKTV